MNGYVLTPEGEALLWGLAVLLEFFVLFALVMLFMRLLTLEQRLVENRERWLTQARDARKQARSVRRKLTGLNEKLVPALFLPNHNLVRKLMWGRMIFRLVSARAARKASPESGST